MQNTQELHNYNKKNGKFIIEPKTKPKSKQLLVISPYLSQLLGFGQGELSGLDFFPGGSDKFYLLI